MQGDAPWLPASKFMNQFRQFLPQRGGEGQPTSRVISNGSTFNQPMSSPSLTQYQLGHLTRAVPASQPICPTAWNEPRSEPAKVEQQPPPRSSTVVYTSPKVIRISSTAGVRESTRQNSVVNEPNVSDPIAAPKPALAPMPDRSSIASRRSRLSMFLRECEAESERESLSDSEVDLFLSRIHISPAELQPKAMADERRDRYKQLEESIKQQIERSAAPCKADRDVDAADRSTPKPVSNSSELSASLPNSTPDRHSTPARAPNVESKAKSPAEFRLEVQSQNPQDMELPREPLTLASVNSQNRVQSPEKAKEEKPKDERLDLSGTLASIIESAYELAAVTNSPALTTVNSVDECAIRASTASRPRLTSSRRSLSEPSRPVDLDETVPIEAPRVNRNEPRDAWDIELPEPGEKHESMMNTLRQPARRLFAKGRVTLDELRKMRKDLVSATEQYTISNDSCATKENM